MRAWCTGLIVTLGVAACSLINDYAEVPAESELGGGGEASTTGGGGSAGATGGSGGDGGCSLPGDCLPDQVCLDGVCVGPGENGYTCVDGTMCQSGFCVEGVCCDGACGGPCMGCRLSTTGAPDGQCAPIGAFDAPKEGGCSPLKCDGMGECAVCGFSYASAPIEGLQCPVECSRCTSEGICTLTCDDPGECADQAIICPLGWHCVVECTGTDACSNAVVNCPIESICGVFCSGASSCNSTIVNCPEFGPCTIACATGSCNSTEIHCGLNECSATCNMPGGVTLFNGMSSCDPMLGC